MRAVIYARYSSENQREASIEDQIRTCRADIEGRGWTYLQAYNDRAISGSSAILRPGYQRMLEDARTGQFDVIVAEALDRLSRDQADIAGLYKQLTFLDIALVTLAEGEINELHVGLKGTMNALYIKDLAQKTRRGQEGRVRQGRSGGSRAYGYDVVKAFDADGNPVRGQRVINEEEAAVVRRIYEAYAGGTSPRATARNLNAEGIPGPSGKPWSPTTLNGSRKRGTGILNNELYIGRLVWNRQRFIKDPATGKRIARLNPPEDWVIHEVPELRIVSQSLWDAVQARKEDQKELSERMSRAAQVPYWDRRRPRYLLSGLLKCGVCGGGYSKISTNLFGCSRARNSGNCGNRLNMRRDVLEATVLDGLRTRLMDPELYQVFAEEFTAELNRLRRRQMASRDTVAAEIAEVERKIRRAVDAITAGVDALALKDELHALEARRAELAARLKNAEPPKPLLHPSLAEVYRRKVADLHEALEDEGLGAEAREAIRSLIDEIVLTPVEGELRIDLKGDLAGILALAADKQRGAPDSRDASEQIKAVAGARSHRELTLPAVPV